MCDTSLDKAQEKLLKEGNSPMEAPNTYAASSILLGSTDTSLLVIPTGITV
jgi:hypothetical protein